MRLSNATCCALLAPLLFRGARVGVMPHEYMLAAAVMILAAVPAAALAAVMLGAGDPVILAAHP